MILKNEDLLHEFYSQKSNDYPELNLDQFKEITFTPWVYLRKEMESGNLETVRLKYFGVFQVYLGRANRMLSNLEQRFKFNKIEQSQYFKIKSMLEKFLKRKNYGKIK